MATNRDLAITLPKKLEKNLATNRFSVLNKLTFDNISENQKHCNLSTSTQTTLSSSDNTESLSAVATTMTIPTILPHGLRTHHTSTNSSNDKLLILDMKILGKPAKVLIDSGSQANVLSSKYIKRCRANLHLDQRQTIPLYSFNGGQSTGKKCPDIEFIFHPDIIDTNDTIVTDIQHDAILGMPWLSKWNPSIDFKERTLTILHRDMKVTLKEQEKVPQVINTIEETNTTIQTVFSIKKLERLLQESEEEVQIFMLHPEEIQEIHKGDSPEPMANPHKLKTAKDTLEYIKTSPEIPEELRPHLLRYQKLFEPVTGMPPIRETDHHIETEPGSTPPYRNLYNLPPAELELLREELNKLLKLGHIRHSCSPYGAPVFYVRQGPKMRLVFDYRALNKITVKDRTALPSMHHAFAALRDATLFTKLDFQSGFHQIRIAEGDQHKTAFRTKYGHFEWTVLPFGLCNSPATFQSTMNKIFHDFLDRFVQIYIDDLAIYCSTNLSDHINQIVQVLHKCEENELRIRLDKCTFAKPSMEYLGYIVENNTVRPNPARLEAIQDWKKPQNTQELHAFIGLCNTVLRHVKDLALYLAPFTNMLRGNPDKNEPVVYTPETSECFRQLKLRLGDVEHLYIPDPNKQFHLFTDYSKKAIGGYIAQLDDKGEMRVISYHSKKLNDAQLKYGAYNGELFGLAEAIRIFRPFIWGCDVIVHTDQRAIQWLLDRHNLLPNQQRWIELFNESNFKIEYIPGKLNTLADILSRKSYHSDISTQTMVHNIRLGINSCTPDQLLQDIISATATDPLAQQFRADLPEHFSFHDQILWYKSNRMYIPPPARLKVLEVHHDSTAAGHFGSKITYEQLRRYYYWPKMEEDTQKYISSCDKCQKNKHRNEKKKGLLEPLPIPPSKWSWISTDAVTHLPKTKNGFDCIFSSTSLSSSIFLIVFPMDHTSDLCSK